MATALADIVDNSISARAEVVNILFDGAADPPYVAILDDGIGMDADAARRAMQLAGTAATQHRDTDDLGRFGLGLKTSSLSQCRRLTIVTKQSDEVTALAWDLDVIEGTGQWSLLVLSPDDVDSVPHSAELVAQANGTLVVWTHLDRLLDEEHDKGRHLDAQMDLVRDHLSLVFHRFIQGDGVAKTSIQLNYADVEAADPFLTRSKRTQVGPTDSLSVGGALVTFQPFTLPYLNTMSRAEREAATSSGTLRDTQGFYVYRAGRLVVWGTWFRLARKNELGRLTRVRVDIPNSLDHLWSLDIKKSAAVPPTVVKNRLRELAARFVAPSHRAHIYRGRKPPTLDPLVRMWSLVEERGAARYEVNRSHPVLQRLADGLQAEELALLEQAVEIIEASFPIQDLFNRMSADTPVEQPVSAPESLMEGLLHLWALEADKRNPTKYFDLITRNEPFNILVDYRPELLERMSAASERG